MWLNSMQREEPYPGLTSRAKPPEKEAEAIPKTGAAWLSSVRAVRCLVKSTNERNPCTPLPARALSVDCPFWEEGGDDVKSVWPLRLGPHTCYNGRHRGTRDREVEQNPENRPQFGLESATRLHEVGFASNGASAVGAVNTFPGLVHTARHIMKAVCTRSRRPNPQGGESPKVWVVIGMKS